MFFFFKYYFLCSHFVLIVLCFLPSTQEFNPRSSTTDELLRDYSSPADKLPSFPPNTCTTIERLGAWRLVQITCTSRLWDSGSATVLNVYSKTLYFRQRTGSWYFCLWNILDSLFLGSCQKHVTARLESLISGRYFMTIARDSLDEQSFRPRLSFWIGIWKNLYLCRE